MSSSILIGQVVSDRMQKSVLVAIARQQLVPKYKFWRKRTSKLMAHDEHDECRVGDTVRIQHCRPRSKDKSHVVLEIVRRAPVFNPRAAAEAAAVAAAAAKAQAGPTTSAPASSAQFNRGFAAGGTQ